jgi:hypothetical protein
MRQLGLWPRNSFSENIGFEFSASDSLQCPGQNEETLKKFPTKQILDNYYTDKKENTNFLIYKEIQKGAVAKVIYD